MAVPENDTDLMQVIVAPRGSDCVLTPENFTRLMGKVVEWRVKIDLTLGQSGQPTTELVVERKLRQELAIKLAMISVLEGYSEETGVPLATLQKKIDEWARSKEGKDTDLGRAAKSLYLGDWGQAEILAGITMKNESARIGVLKRVSEEVKKKTLESVQSFISGAYFKVLSQKEQGKWEETLKTVDELDELFARQVSKEEFKEEWGGEGAGERRQDGGGVGKAHGREPGRPQRCRVSHIESDWRRGRGSKNVQREVHARSASPGTVDGGGRALRLHRYRARG